MNACAYSAPFLRSEFNAGFRYLKIKKALGVDEILGELLQNSSENIIDAI